MSTEKPDKRQDYDVLAAYRCPKKKCWHQAGETVSLLPSEAEFLKRSSKIRHKSAAAVAIKKGDK